MKKKGTMELCVRRRGGGTDGNFTVIAKPHLSLYPEYSSRLTTLKIPTTVNPEMKLVTAAARRSGILKHVRSCVGKAAGLRSTNVAARWFGLMPANLLLSQRTTAQVAFPKLLVWPWNCLLLPLMKYHSIPLQRSNVTKMVKRSWECMPGLHAKGRAHIWESCWKRAVCMA